MLPSLSALMQKFYNGAAATFETAAMGFDPSTGRTPVEQANNYAYIPAATALGTTVVKAAPGFLHSITFGTPVATSVITIADVASGATNPIAVITLTADLKPFTLILDVLCTVGITVTTATAQVGVTVAFR